MLGLASLFGFKQTKSKSTLENEISTEVSNQCRPASCTNISSGAIKIGRVGPGCDFKAMQTCKADATCIIDSAVDTMAKTIKESKFTGGMDMSKSVVQIESKDTVSGIKTKLKTAVDNICGGSTTTNVSSRPVDIAVCEGKFDMSQYGDAKSKCAIKQMTKAVSDMTVKDSEDYAASTMMFLGIAGVLGVIGLVVFIKIMKAKAGGGGAYPGGFPGGFPYPMPMPQAAPQFIPIPIQMPTAAASATSG
jgi:hypothetical protein